MFRFSAERELKDRLGEQDALVELQEVARRFLGLRLAASADPPKELARIAEEVGVKVSPRNLDDVGTQGCHAALIVVNAAADQFMDDAANEATEVIGSDILAAYHEARSRSKPLSRLDALLSSARKCRDSRPEDGELRHIAVFKYYEDLRHAVAHRDARDPKRLSAAHATITAELPKCWPEIKVLPERFEKLRFDDFWLFTFCTKRVARMVCRLLQPSDDEFARAVLSQARAIVQRPTRLHRGDQAIASLLRTCYGLDVEHAARVADLVARELGGGAPPSTRA